MSRDLLLFLEDIEKACAKISRYSERLSRDEVFADEMRFDGILHTLQTNGESASIPKWHDKDLWPSRIW